MLMEKGVNTSLKGGITCEAIDEPRKSSCAIDERVIINFRDKKVVINGWKANELSFLLLWYMTIANWLIAILFYQ